MFVAVKHRLCPIITILFLVCSVVIGLTRYQLRQSGVYAYNSSNLLRFHVLANSDTLEDQAVKKDVRDAVLKETGKLFEQVDNAREARLTALRNLNKIEAVANRVLEEQGKPYKARAVVGKFKFPVKQYGDLVLPPGEYEAVRILLGKAQGQNWWCVLFPPLCIKDFDSGYAISATQRVSAVKALGKAGKKAAKQAPKIRFSLRAIEHPREEDIVGELVWHK